MTRIDKDVVRLARGRDVERAQAVLAEHCAVRREAIVGKILKHLRNPDAGPLEAAQAVQSWLELSAVADLQRDLDKQIREGDLAGKRVEQAVS